MTYTIKIAETNPKATSIINMLKMLALDYDFVEIYEGKKIQNIWKNRIDT